MQIILWSAIFGDWNVKLGAERLKQKMMEKLNPGEVLLLHDCGRTPGADETAPANMLIALEAYMEEATKRGYQFVGIAELIKLTEKHQTYGMEKTIVGAWLLYEQLFHLVFRLKHVGEDNHCFHYRVIKYNGDPIKLADDGYLNKGDKVVELHFDNKMLSTIATTSSSPLATGIRMLREVEQALPVLANVLANDPKQRGSTFFIWRNDDPSRSRSLRLPSGASARWSIRSHNTNLLADSNASTYQ